MRALQRHLAVVMLGLALTGLQPATAQQPPELLTFTPADAARARDGAAGGADVVAPCRVQEDAPTSRLDPFSDNDAAHYARGSVLVVLVFVNHAGGSWSAERTH